VVSDISVEINKYIKEFENIVVVDEVECECCGHKEDCSPAYIAQVEESYSGNWVCGLCSEAVKERLARGAPKIAIREAVSSHREFCQKFNTTTRLNPNLSLTCTMRDIAKRSCEKRNSSITKLARTTSCNVPGIGGNPGSRQ
jgi:hypothetical protein